MAFGIVTDSKHKDAERLLEGHGTNKALELLEDLNDSPFGKLLYQQVEHILRESDHTQDKIVRGYVAVIQVLISAFRKSLPKDSLLYFELKLIQKRLNPPISISEIAVLHQYLRSATKLISDVAKYDKDIFAEAFSPILTGEVKTDSIFDEGRVEQPERESFIDKTLRSSQESQAEQKSRTQSSEKNRSQESRTPESRSPEPRTVTPVNYEERPLTPQVEQTIDSIYRNKLSQHHKEILEIQANLADKVGATMRQQETFGKKLQLVLEQLEYPEKNKKTDHMRNNLMHEIEGVLGEQSNVTQMMHDTQSFLHLIGSNIRKLSDELDQVRVLSLTDELTQLPNRRAFLRRIKDEMDRAQRDKTLLTIAIIDLDKFKNINDKYGHAVGDEMLRVYSREILSIFRRYDMVARYGGEEFAVLLPNTDRAGAERAFGKVRSKAIETSIINNGDVLRVPTFSAGLAIFSPGETVELLIERADNALYKAKKNGRDRVEFDPKYLGDDRSYSEKAK